MFKISFSSPYKLFIGLFTCCLFTGACAKIDVFEKNVAIKNHSWNSAVQPAISFIIEDTSSFYNIYLILRHSDSYDFNNIWMNITRSGPDTSYTSQADIKLADNAKGWMGTGMDDIFEHRVRLTAEPVQFKKSGEYVFTLQHIMRQDPLQHVLNVGMRVERVK